MSWISFQKLLLCSDKDNYADKYHSEYKPTKLYKEKFKQDINQIVKGWKTAIRMGRQISDEETEGQRRMQTDIQIFGQTGASTLNNIHKV